jgi:hypothetical protein
MHNSLKATAVALFLAACGSKATVSLTARAASTSTGQALTVAGGVNLTRVRMVIQKIELERELIVDGGTRQGEVELAVGPFLIDLRDAQLDNGISKVFSVNAEPGNYKEIVFKIHRLEDAETGSSPALAEMGRFSIRIEGTRNGTRFTFDSALDEEQEREGNFTLHSGENNLAFNVNPAGWFINGTTPLDPTDPSARAKIESNIKASIDLFQDDDHRGHR